MKISLNQIGTPIFTKKAKKLGATLVDHTNAEVDFTTNIKGDDIYFWHWEYGMRPMTEFHIKAELLGEAIINDFCAPPIFLIDKGAYEYSHVCVHDKKQNLFTVYKIMWAVTLARRLSKFKR